MPEDNTIENRKSKIANTRAGFTVVELLVGLAISAMLLVAVAVAFNASATNYRENEDIFKAINSARQALFRMTNQLRTADAVDPNAPNNECTMITAAGENITYRYNSGDKTLYLITNDDLSDSDYVLCDNVTAMTCTKTTVVVDAMTIVKSVQISMTVESDDVKKTISAAAAIRRNLN
ncbi:MAG: prepilin-type N-terminal cleavage/methylation domain-containing protein [Planctomycetota bacterium]|jgi:prepilin-type N-terminal cleavage/methylation domain-containing protein